MLQFFAMLAHESSREVWYEVVTVRDGRAYRAVNLTYGRARAFCEYLADKYSVADRAGMFAGSIIRV